MASINGRKVKRFRTHIDASLTAMPKNSLDVDADGLEAEITPAGIYVHVLPQGKRSESEHIVPFANVTSIKLLPEEKSEKPEKK